MPGHINVVCLKLDFKIDESNQLRIVDLGDGLGADIGGFDDALPAIALRDMQEATDAPLATLFGELPYDAMQPESIHVPLILRPSTSNDLIEAHDLSLCQEPFLPYSELGRLQSYISYAWGKKLNNPIVTPIALMAIEMHKVLWYFLMEKHMKPGDQQHIIYWCNDCSIDLDLSEMKAPHGFFIKIADRSQGGGGDVYYAKNKQELLKVLDQLKKTQDESRDGYKKHLFVIEPAYITIKRHQGRDYNVTGRAFVTLIYDQTTKTLQDVKIAGAKWMFPKIHLQSDMTQDQMLSNIKHSIAMVSLDKDELLHLSKALLGAYGEVFKAGIEENNLMGYCAEHPSMKLFLSCLRPTSSYVNYLKIFETQKTGQQDDTDWTQFIMYQIHGLIARDHFQQLNLEFFKPRPSFFTPPTESLNDLMKKICRFSFFENYITQRRFKSEVQHSNRSLLF